MSEFFSMIRHVGYITRQLQEDLMLRDMISRTQCSMVDVPRYYPIKRSGFGTSPVKDAYWQLSGMKQGMPLDDPIPLNLPEIPDGLAYAYQEGLKLMGCDYPGKTVRFRRFKPAAESVIPLSQGIDPGPDPISFNEHEVLRHQYNQIFKAMDESVDKGIGFGVMLESLKEVGNKKDFPPNWGKVNV